MTPERWREVTQIYGAVLSRATERRAAAVEELCGTDVELRREIESLLESQHGASLLGRPAGEHPSVIQMLTIGSQIGAFRIDSLLGVGGMGEVYRARDTKLNRDVAIKILPPVFANDRDRLARFKREAQVLASVNHPNIATIHGFEDSGGLHALVLELVEGPTLADRIERGRLEVDEAIAIARQIADALEAAHGQGIIHRDLKPANIKVRDDGTVKVLDFGLAKIAEADGAGGAGQAGRAGVNTQSPTITTPAMTAAGMILGTAAYMSPEQAKGKPADKRSDIWAFGCVLYEMLAGKRAFDGEDVSDTLAAILRGEPDWWALPAGIPVSVRTLIQRSLARNLSQRLSDIAVAKFLLAETDAANTVESVTPPAPVRRSSLPILILTAVAAVVVSVLIAAAWSWRFGRSEPTPLVARFAVPLPDGQTFPSGSRPMIAISPDGSQIVYVANSQLYLRTLSELQPRPIPGTEFKDATVSMPAFSPDGQRIVFFTTADNSIRSIPVTGGSATTLAHAQASVLPYGISWDEEWITFADGRSGIFRVSEKGGQPEHIVDVNSNELPDAPHMLPGGQHVLFTLADAGNNVPGPMALDRWEKAKIVVQSLATGERKTLIEGGASARLLPTGHLIFAQMGNLVAARLDLRQMKVLGTPRPVVEGVSRSISAGSGVAHFSVSNNGTLVFVPGPVRPVGGRSLMIVDARGSATAVPLAPGPYLHPRLSRDGNQIAFENGAGGDTNIWIYDLRTNNNAPRRLTYAGNNAFPVWSPDGDRVAFQSDRDGNPGIWAQRADGVGAVDQLTKAESGEPHIPQSWSRDRHTLLYSVHKDGLDTLWTLSLSEKKRRRSQTCIQLNPSTRPFHRMVNGSCTARTTSPGEWSLPTGAFT
jgi:serine/threonine-protein kinase